MNTTKELKGWR